jgi:ADP-heptose:LPS heptosyltransferase
MPDAVVIQWSRLGDLLQTRVLLDRIRRSADYDRVILSYDARYQSVAEHLPEVDDLWPIDLGRFSKTAKQSDGDNESFSALCRWGRAMRSMDVAATFVLSRSIAAAAFAELMNPRKSFGYTQDRGELVVPDKILELEQSFENNNFSPVHIADLWAEYCGRNAPPCWPQSLGAPSDKNLQSGTCSMRIALLCDAGEEYRSIPEKWLHSLALELCSHSSVEVVLLGVSSSTGGDLLAALKNDSVLDLRGKTSLSALSQYLADSDAVIGPDTGGLHLAAALRAFVIGLYFGGAHCVYTGPYASRAAVIQDPIWSATSAQEVAQLALNLTTQVGRRFNTHQFMISRNVWLPSLGQHGLIYSRDSNSGHQETMVMQESELDEARPI